MKRTLELVGETLPTAQDVASEQVKAARELLTRDISKAPRWMWSDLNALCGPMLPGDLIVIGALHNNGKSALLMTQMDVFAEQEIPTFYIPLEIDPANCRVRWAAWRLGLDPRPVIQQDWGALPHGAQAAIGNVLTEQEANRFIQFAPPKRPTMGELVRWFKWARREFDAKVVMLDHLHRVDVGGDASSHRVSATDFVRKLKDQARELGLVVIAAAQLNRSSDPIDAYTPPHISRLKETSGIAEEADVVLMLSRKLRRDLPDGWQQDLRTGKIDETQLAEAGVMMVTCRKHRLDGAALNCRVRLYVEQGRVVQPRRPGI